MRIAVTGAGGGIGTALLERPPREHDVLPFTHQELPVEDRDAVLDRLGSATPDAVLHLGAMTAVDRCEEDPDAAFRVNAEGTANVALAARRAGALLLYVSTDYVFDGEKGEPYHEFDEPGPLSVYGWSKLMGEREARALAPDHLVVRTSWVFGAENDFVTGAVRKLAAGQRVVGLVDRVSTPTYVRHIAERLVPLAASGRRGVVHLAGPEVTTWHDVLERARRLGELPGEVAEGKTGDLGLPAARPRNSALRSLVLEEHELLPPLDEALGDLVEAARGH